MILYYLVGIVGKKSFELDFGLIIFRILDYYYLYCCWVLLFWFERFWAGGRRVEFGFEGRKMRICVFVGSFGWFFGGIVALRIFGRI